MMKFTYTYKNYDYGSIGRQPYDIKAEMVVKKEASAIEVIETLIDFMKIAGYQEESIMEAIAVAAGSDVPSFEEKFNILLQENEVNK